MTDHAEGVGHRRGHAPAERAPDAETVRLLDERRQHGAPRRCSAHVGVSPPRRQAFVIQRLARLRHPALVPRTRRVDRRDSENAVRLLHLSRNPRAVLAAELVVARRLRDRACSGSMPTPPRAWRGLWRTAPATVDAAHAIGERELGRDGPGTPRRLGRRRAIAQTPTKGSSVGGRNRPGRAPARAPSRRSPPVGAELRRGRAASSRPARASVATCAENSFEVKSRPDAVSYVTAVSGHLGVGRAGGASSRPPRSSSSPVRRYEGARAADPWRPSRRR